MTELADHGLYYMHDIINELTSYYVNVHTIRIHSGGSRIVQEKGIMEPK